MKKIKRREFVLFLSVIGPGIITACADNDAGGIATYSTAGAHYGYSLLWLLFIITFSLGLFQEMCARMGAVTGKGLSDLIREEFGVRWTFFVMLSLLIANITTTVADFAGIAASLEIFGISKYLSIPLMAFLIWFVVIKGSYRRVERIFFIFATFQIAYVLARFLSRPHWTTALSGLFIPHFRLETNFLLIAIGLIGTTITPWMQFYIQASVVDKGITARHYKYERADVLFGAFITDFVAFFIIVACAATLLKQGIHIETAKEAALALKPLAGTSAETLFAVGLFGASTLHCLNLAAFYRLCGL